MGHLFTLKRAEEDLFNSRQMLLSVLDTIPQRVFWKDRNSVYVGCNKHLALDFGYASPSELIGKTDLAIASASSANSYRADDRYVIETGRSKLNYEEVQIKPDGSQAWLRTSKVPLRDKEGNVIGVLGTSEDITEQKRAMETLKLLSHAVKSIRECISIADLDNKLLFVNDAFLHTYGLQEQDIIGRSINVVTCDSEISDQDILNKTINGGWQGERLNRRKDGTIFPIYLTTSVVSDEKGQPIALVGVATDITERKQAEEQLRASLLEKDVLLKETHHRVKNNLQVISSLLSLQSEAIKDPRDVALFNDSQNRIRSMALIHEQLYRSRSLSAIDSKEYIQMLSSEIMRSHAHDGILLELDIEPIQFNIDTAIPCGLIVNELLSNALKHAFPDRKQGIIRIRLKSETINTYLLIVSDNGVGLRIAVSYY
jgi:PAS domain S-box-containing protein